MIAKIKVLHVFKGDASTEIELHYHVDQPPGAEVNGPYHISLEKDQRYRFFLKKDPESKDGYVGVLEGIFDDGSAVEKLGPKDADDEAYIKHDDLIKIARDYIESKKSDLPYDWTQPLINGPEMGDGSEWQVVIYIKPLSASQKYAFVLIRGDGTVDEKNSELSTKWPPDDK